MKAFIIAIVVSFVVVNILGDVEPRTLTTTVDIYEAQEANR